MANFSYEGSNIEYNYRQEKAKKPKFSFTESLVNGLEQGANYTLYQGTFGVKALSSLAGLPNNRAIDDFLERTRNYALDRIKNVQEQFELNSNIKDKTWVNDVAFGIGSMANPLSLASMYAGGGLATGIRTAGTKIGLNFVNGALGRIATTGIAEAITNQDQLLFDNLINKSIYGQYLSGEENLKKAVTYGAFGAVGGGLAEGVSWALSKRLATKGVGALTEMDIEKISNIRKSIDNLPEGKTKTSLNNMLNNKLNAFQDVLDRTSSKTTDILYNNVTDDFAKFNSIKNISEENFNKLGQLGDLVYRDLLDGKEIDYIKPNVINKDLMSLIKSVDREDIIKLIDLNDKKVKNTVGMENYLNDMNSVGKTLNDDLDTVESLSESIKKSNKTTVEEVVPEVKTIDSRLENISQASDTVSKYVEKNKEEVKKMLEGSSDLDVVSEIIAKETGKDINSSKKIANNLLGEVKVKSDINDFIKTNDALDDALDVLDEKLSTALGKEKGYIKDEILPQLNKVPTVEDITDSEALHRRVNQMFQDVDGDIVTKEISKDNKILDEISLEAKESKQKFYSDNAENIEARIMDNEENIQKILDEINVNDKSKFTLEDAKKCLVDALNITEG